MTMGTFILADIHLHQPYNLLQLTALETARGSKHCRQKRP